MGLRENLMRDIDYVGNTIIDKWECSNKNYNDYNECITDINKEIDRLNKKTSETSLAKWVFVFTVKAVVFFVVFLVCGQAFKNIDDLAIVLIFASILFAYQSQNNGFLDDALAKTEAVIIFQRLAQRLTLEFLKESHNKSLVED